MLHFSNSMTQATYANSSKTKIESGRLIGKFIGDERGATLIAVGSLHGNEPGGAAALRRVSQKLAALRGSLRGRVYFLAGNTRALSRGARFVDADLNRHWTDENILKCRANQSLKNAEDLELHELLSIFDDILETARTEVFALDLHSTSAGGAPFGLVGDTLRNRRFAQGFPVRLLLGIEEQLDGTMLEYLNNRGAVTLGFEGGQHTAEATIENHEALVWLALVNSGILSEKAVPDLERPRNTLTQASGNPEIIEIRHREAIEPEDEFEMLPGFKNFDPVKYGQTLARNRQGNIEAPESGLILMPLYQKQGADGFFIGRRIARFWLRISEILRKLKISDRIHLLPGVRRDPTNDLSFIIDTRVARFFPLQVFHLLGFRKLRWRGRRLIVSRRRHDTRSPFKAKERQIYGR